MQTETKNEFPKLTAEDIRPLNVVMHMWGLSNRMAQEIETEDFLLNTDYLQNEANGHNDYL